MPVSTPLLPLRLCSLLILGLSAIFLAASLILAYTHWFYEDDFLNAGTICKLFYGTPYRDFTPWNNLLGHYIQAPALFLFPDVWLGLAAIRTEMALINGAAVLAGAWWIARKFNPETSVFALLAVCTMSTFLYYSTEVRLDMLSAWIGFLSFCLLLSSRYTLAGAAAAFSFLISHKGAYQIGSGLIALSAMSVLSCSYREGIKQLARYCLGIFVPTAAYYVTLSLLWNAASGIAGQIEGKVVILSHFYHNYRSLRYTNWRDFFTSDYFFCLLALTGIGVHLYLVARERKSGPIPKTLSSLVIAGIYTLVLFLLSLSHTHVYRYFQVIIIPQLWYMCAFSIHRFLSWFASLAQEQRRKIILAGFLFFGLAVLNDIPLPWWIEDSAKVILFLSGLLLMAALFLAGKYLPPRLAKKNQESDLIFIRIALAALLLAAAPLGGIYEALNTYYDDCDRAYTIYGNDLNKLQQYRVGR